MLSYHITKSKLNHLPTFFIQTTHKLLNSPILMSSFHYSSSHTRNNILHTLKQYVRHNVILE